MQLSGLLSNYIFWLLSFSALVGAFEIFWPARAQKVMRKWLWSDYLHLVFNGHLLGLLLAGVVAYHIKDPLENFLTAYGLKEALFFDAVSGWGWGLVIQSLVALVVLDFTQWLVHNTLHRSNFLWEIHKVHHSVKEGEMDWIVSFRFSWLEPVIYKTVMYIPMVWFGFASEALFFHAVFGTLIGHLNHANLTWDYGPLRYVFNSPRMHLYHHAYDAPAQGQNFGITLSCWDWIFGTAYLPEEPCPKIGFPGVEDLPNDFFGQMIWPLPHWVRKLGQGTRPLTSLMGVTLLFAMYGASLPPKPKTVMFDEPMASSQPFAKRVVTDDQRATSPEKLDAAIQGFGKAAREAGWSHPEYSITAVELALALGSTKVSILDVRAGEDYRDRFAAGHIPSAQLVTRSDYSGGDVPGMSLDQDVLQAMLRARGVQQGDELIIMGDGGPEPYRLWWTLLRVAGVKARVLDGGLAAWKSIGEAIASGEGLKRTGGTISLTTTIGERIDLSRMDELRAQHSSLQMIDTRSYDEFIGQILKSGATRKGRIPGAHHLDWTEVLHLIDQDKVDGGVPVLKNAEMLKALMTEHGLSWDQPTITYCQSGTRSAALYFGLVQAGFNPEKIWNYDGSWAEYSRTDREISTGEI